MAEATALLFAVCAAGFGCIDLLGWWLLDRSEG
jgi:hypothetical protein